jgi:pimeloyl-ACP methyl ester carboxylesterase
LAGACALVALAALVNVAVARRSERDNPPKGKFVTVHGVRLHYLERGEGPPVVLLHGNGAMAEDFALSGVIDLVAERHRVIAFDRPGFGHSDRPRGKLWTAHAQAELLHAACEQLGIKRPIVVGHSWGTSVALNMGLEYPKKIAGLVLVSGYYMPDARPDVLLGVWPAIPVLGDVVRYTVSPLIGWLSAHFIFKKLFAPTEVDDRFEKGFPLGLALRPSQIRASAADTAFMIPDAASTAARHGELKMPVIVIAGDGDRIVDTDKQSRRLANDIAQSDFRVVVGAGHMVHYIAPQQISGAIEEISTAA